jgi:hypothetical protein
MLLLPQKTLRSSARPIRTARPLRPAQNTWRWSRTSIATGATKQSAPLALVQKKKTDGPSTDLGVILGRLSQVRVWAGFRVQRCVRERLELRLECADGSLRQ